jgi:hypothetical protein
MSEFVEVDPDRVRAVGVRVDEISGVVGGLSRRTHDLASVPMLHNFPALAAGQDAARRWDEARSMFADGLNLLACALGNLASGMERAATGYQASDTESSARSAAINHIQLPL